MSDVLNLFAGLTREQIERFRALAMPTMWALRTAVETNDQILTVDLSRAVAPPQKVTTKPTKGVPKDE